MIKAFLLIQKGPRNAVSFHSSPSSLFLEGPLHRFHVHHVFRRIVLSSSAPLTPARNMPSFPPSPLRFHLARFFSQVDDTWLPRVQRTFSQISDLIERQSVKLRTTGPTEIQSASLLLAREGVDPTLLLAAEVRSPFTYHL